MFRARATRIYQDIIEIYYNLVLELLYYAINIALEGSRGPAKAEGADYLFE
jgi:hypothetical protein